MKKKTALKSAFFNPRVIGIASCAIVALLALLAFGLYPGGEALATDKQANNAAPSESQRAARMAAITQSYHNDDIDAPSQSALSAAPLPVDPNAVDAVFVVNTTNDTADVTPGDGLCADSVGACSLRAAITESNAAAGADTITLPAGTYTTTLAAANENANAGGDYDILQSVTINGAGSGTTIIQANAAPFTATERVFHILAAGITVDINNVTIRNGMATGVTSGGGISIAAAATVGFTNCVITNNRIAPPTGNSCFGGAMIMTAGTVTMTNCSVTNNSAIAGASTTTFGFAGGIYNQQGALTLNNCTVSGNISNSFHGGIRTLASTAAIATTTINNSTVSNNVSQGINGAGFEGEGGGIASFATSTFACTTSITRSTISNNAAQVSSAPGANTAAGGVENIEVAAGVATINLTQSTVSGNTAAFGGGIYTNGAGSVVNLDYSTVAANSATTQNGGMLQDTTGTINLKDSIVADNTAPVGPDIGGTITSQGFNHVENTAGGTFTAIGGDVTGSDPGLSPLQNNGGPTFSHMPSAGSPVLNTIASGTNGCGTTFTTDQRGAGFVRPSGGACEKGSIERQPNDATPTPTPSQTPTSTATATASATATATFTPVTTPTVTPPATECLLTQQFFDVTTLIPGGWSVINNSSPIGSTTWFQGNSANFPAQSGAANSYVSVNFNSTTGTNTISNWLLTPPITLQNGAVLKFWTRTVDEPQFPDRLQVRMSTNGNSQNVGFGALGTGDFSTLLLDINPTYLPVPQPAGTPTPSPFPTPTPGVGYPNVWTQFTVTISGVAVPIKGRLAFRYFVENGGPTGANSDTIGIDTVQYACTGPLQTPTPQPTPTPTPSPSPSPSASPSPGCGVTLYDQTNSASTTGTSSQNFEAANDAFDDMAADDFVVPASGWTIQKVNVNGSYYNGTGPATSVNVVFYNNAGGLPGAVVAGGTFNNAPMVDTAGSFSVTLTPSLALTAGTYWVSVQANMDFAGGLGQWAWTDRSITSNSPAAWQNPGGGFAAGCLTWGTRSTTCGIDAPNPDQAFLLIGCGPAATPPPTPTPTPSPTPTPGSCQFTPAPVIPQTILDEAVVSVGGNLYTFGGVSTTIIANAYKFDGTTWTAIAPLPVALEYPSAVTDGTDIYIMGGADTAGNAVTTLYRYNVGANNYTTLAPFTTATWNQAAVYLSGKIYKFAGTETVTDTSVNALEIYDVAGNSWSAGANYPTALSFVSGWAQGGFVYGAGGINATSSLESNKTYRYDPAGNTWNDLAIADLPAPRWASANGFYTCCTTIGGIMAGGYSNGLIVATTLIWDSGSNTWLTLNQLNGERTRMGGAAVGCNFYVVGGRSNASNAFVGTNDNQRFNCPCAPSPTPTPIVNISGTVTYCSNPALPGIDQATMSLTGPTPAPASTLTNASGNYTLTGLFGNSNYVVTPTKTARLPGTAGINTVDVIAIQKHFLIIGTPLSGCPLLAADVNGVSGVNTVDVIAVQRFFLSLSTGIANTGKYQFIPASRSYTPVGNINLTGENYNAIIFGDVVGFISPPRADGDPGIDSSQVPSTVESVALPQVGGQGSINAPVTTSQIDAKSNLVGFQGDFTFDERVVTFQEQPVQKAGLTAGNWNVSAAVQPGKGPIRTLRISAFSNDFSPLSGSGTLFELNMNRVSKSQDAKLAWAPAPDQFMFIDADLNTQTPNAR